MSFLPSSTTNGYLYMDEQTYVSRYSNGTAGEIYGDQELVSAGLDGLHERRREERLTVMVSVQLRRSGLVRLPLLPRRSLRQ